MAHIAAEPRQIVVQDPVQQQGSPTASLSYTSFEDDSLQQSLVTLQEVCLDQEVCRLEQLLQDLSSTCSSLADKVGANAHARRVARQGCVSAQGCIAAVHGLVARDATCHVPCTLVSVIVEWSGSKQRLQTHAGAEPL